MEKFIILYKITVILHMVCIVFHKNNTFLQATVVNQALHNCIMHCGHQSMTLTIDSEVISIGNRMDLRAIKE